MPTPFELLPHCSFGGISAPLLDWSRDFEGRDKVHEYPHTHGGDAEKLGRKLMVYSVKLMFDVWFHNKGYPDLWPERLTAMQDLFERQVTRELVLPTMGTIVCYCTRARTIGNAEVQSGEIVEATFREERPIAVDALMGPALSRLDGLDFNLKKAVVRQYDLGLLDDNTVSLFDLLGGAIRSIARIKDTVDLFGQKIEVFTQQALDLCNVIDGLTDLANPENNPVIDPFHDLWDGLVRFEKDMQRKRRALSRIPLLAPMSINDVAVKLYGSTELVSELLSLNAIDDPFRIPAGFELRFYPP